MNWTITKIQNLYKSKKEQTYIFFWGHQPSKDGHVSKACFSQWWPCQFKDDTFTYSSAEQYMMTEKVKLFGDLTIRQQIIDCKNPKQIKVLGRKIENFDQLTWDKEKISIVTQGNFLKFKQNSELKQFLLSTKNKIRGCSRLALNIAPQT